MPKPYELNEKDIDSALRFLEIFDPENATPEMAIELLEEMQAGIHTMSHENPDLMEQTYVELRAKKRPRT
jgi:hypothetical protein